MILGRNPWQFSKKKEFARAVFFAPIFKKKGGLYVQNAYKSRQRISCPVVIQNLYRLYKKAFAFLNTSKDRRLFVPLREWNDNRNKRACWRGKGSRLW